jgi:stage V sporulation protein D (sporulation-specific penicillin-binding protein)
MKLRRRRARLYLVGGGFVLATALLCARLVQIQYVRHDHYAALGHEQRFADRTIQPLRGGIFDRSGRPLALSARLFSVSVSPGELGSRHVAASRLSRALGVRRGEIVAKLATRRPFVWLARQCALDDDARAKLEAMRGVTVHREWGRVYPYDGVASKLVGFVGHDNHGGAGVEAMFDRQLSGEAGGEKVLRNGQYDAERFVRITTKRPRDGVSLYLTIDAVVQEIAEQELRRAIRAYGARSGAIILMEVATGEILALAEHPSVTSRSAGALADSLWTIRSVSHVYEPGSTFKVVTAAAMLESGGVAPEDSFDAEDGMARFEFGPIRDPHPHGVLSFEQAFSLSSNIVMAKASRRVEPQTFYRFVRLFGFGTPTGVDLLAESPGAVPEVEDWSLRTKSTMAFGQEVAVTPLQMLAAVAAVANDGVLVMPRLVAAIGNGRKMERFEPVDVRRVVSPETARTLQRFCRVVVEEGTGAAARVDGLAVSGKTGTAQKAAPRGGYAAGRYVSSFIGYVLDDAPRVACLVLIDEPRPSARFGGDSAAPVFARVIKGVMNATTWFDGALETRAIVLERPSTRLRSTPNFLRMERGAALEHARRIGANVLCRGDAGRVVAQEPVPGSAVEADGVIRLYVADLESEPVRQAAPDLRGLAMREAKRRAVSQGLRVALRGGGVVRAQSPAPGARTQRGEVILFGDAAEALGGGAR